MVVKLLVIGLFIVTVVCIGTYIMKRIFDKEG
jgi:uncharacterized protein YneF (UPF0154 family)